MSQAPARVVCAGCAAELAITTPLPFVCPGRRAGDEIDHVLGFSVDVRGERLLAEGEPNPFLRYRRLLWIWHAAMAYGLTDRDYVELVTALDDRVAKVDGHGFVVTPYRFSAALSTHYKDETHNVAGSHKARHLMGLAIYLAIVEAAGAAPWTTAAASAPSLAIASCGNAALAAAVVAKAAARTLRVFVPPWASPVILDRLGTLGAEISVCERRPGDPAGDPCYRAFQAAVAAGALPFSCQGTDNGLTIDGGRTLGLELAAQHAASGAPAPSHVFLQVGGGALASAAIQALEMAVTMGALAALPAIMAVQTEGGHPFHRAWSRIVAHPGGVAEALDDALGHRSAYMTPWESEPTSLADGILDDETYDWWQIARGIAASGGDSVLASEEDLRAAVDDAATLEIRASHTGAAGHAGLLAMRRRTSPTIPRPIVLFTGVSR